VNNLIEVLMIIIEENNWKNEGIHEGINLIERYYSIILATNTRFVNFSYYNSFIL
jgi:hypothetical protein